MNKYADKINEIKTFSNNLDDLIIDLLSVKKFLRSCDTSMFGDHKHEWTRFYNFSNKRVETAVKTMVELQNILEEKIDEN